MSWPITYQQPLQFFISKKKKCSAYSSFSSSSVTPKTTFMQQLSSVSFTTNVQDNYQDFTLLLYEKRTRNPAHQHQDSIMLEWGELLDMNHSQ